MANFGPQTKWDNKIVLHERAKSACSPPLLEVIALHDDFVGLGRAFQCVLRRTEGMLSVGISPKDSIAVLRRESSAASKAVRFLASAHGRASVRRLTLLYRLPRACLLARWN